jgi:diadenosine tetraphosphate (Ap4A) HIT family hydrolase
MAESALAVAFEDAFPVSPGHTLVVPRRHVGSYFDCTPDERAAIWKLVEEVRGQIVSERGPDGFNVGINVGAAAGQTVLHAHVHVVPRFAGDVADPRGGVRGVIPGKALY